MFVSASYGYILAAAAIFVVIVTMRTFAPEVYDLFIADMTQKWYAAVLCDLNTRTRDEARVMLDVGVGTAAALVRNKGTLINSNIKIVGVDPAQDYIEKVPWHPTCTVPASFTSPKMLLSCPLRNIAGSRCN